jgi:uncharacterized membrane protein YphA (DoxX/SURF4 family)
MSLDIVLIEICMASIAIIFLLGAWQKLRDVMAFEIALEAYELVPPQLTKVLAWSLPLLEICAAICLAISATRELGAALALVLLTIVTGAVAINLLRGHTDIGCGCGGLEDEQTLSWALVGRNVIISVGVLAGLSNPATRALNGLDYFTITAGSLCCYGLYVLSNQLIANQPRLISLRANQ